MSETMSERVYSQPYRTEASEARFGVIECIMTPDQPTQFAVHIKQGTVNFPSLPEAEAWLQKRELSGSKLIKG